MKRTGVDVMKKLEQLYEGKAKKVYATDEEGYVIVSYKDDATALDGQKRGTIVGKGAINNRMTNFLMQLLSEKGVPTHFVKEGADRSVGGHYPEHFRRVLCQTLWCGRGDRVRGTHH